ncbi:hypothetical protein [Brevundimonas sp.]|jgi:hypothetical protein|uniref:hypothetical protein n=1 Tax=Brevundimonas sp. TaxID=1871086 RepID=UPI0037848E21
MMRLACLAPLAVLALAACEQAQEPASAPPVAGAPAAPVTPAPAADPNVLTAEGMGPVRIGMTTAEVTAAWGTDANPDAVGGAELEVCDEYHPANAPAGVRVMIEEGRLTRIAASRDATVKTDRGFGVGDSATAIKQAYGGAVIAQPHKYQDAPAEDLFAWSRGGSTNYVQDPAARGVRYEIGSDGKVMTVMAGGPSIQLVEGCS